jgi:small-conductance mechanosensitive channel
MVNAGILRVAFAANIMTLVPVCWTMFTGTTAAVFNGSVEESVGLRLMVGSLWAAILVASMAGLVQPKFFAPVILIQVFYKALWLVLFVLPAIRSKGSVPTGIAIVFVAIVLSYPVLYWLAQ